MLIHVLSGPSILSWIWIDMSVLHPMLAKRSQDSFNWMILSSEFLAAAKINNYKSVNMKKGS